MSARRVVVTGIGAVSPLGLTAASTWEGMLSRTLGGGADHPVRPRRIRGSDRRRGPRFRAGIGVRPAPGQAPGPGHAAGPGGRRRRPWPRRSSTSAPIPHRVGVVFGTGIGGIRSLEEGMAVLLRAGPGVGEPLHVADDDPQHGGRAGGHGMGHPGLQLLHGHRLLGVRPGHRRGTRPHPGRPGRRHGLRRERGADHPGRHRRLRGHEGPVDPQRRARGAPPVPSMPGGTASSWGRGPPCWCWRSARRPCAGARRSWPSWPATAPPPTPTT